MKTFFPCGKIIGFFNPIIIFSVFFIFTSANTIQAGEYGYLIDDNQICSLWWAEGAYKVMKDDPIPVERKSQILIIPHGSSTLPLIH